MKKFLQQLNEYIGALLLTATLALGTNAVVGYGADQRTDQRLLVLERFAEQQAAINDSVAVLAQHVAVLQDRQDRPLPGAISAPKQ